MSVEERRRQVAEAEADLAAATTKAEAATKRARGVLGDDPAVVSGITRGAKAARLASVSRDNAYRAEHEQIAARQTAERRLAVAQRLLAQAEADSAAAANFETLAPGDLVRQAGSSSWHVVLRANAKTVSVTSGYSWAVRVPRDRIAETRKQQPTAELAAQVRGAL